MDHPGNPSLTAFDEVKQAVFVCAHADDLETLAGGTVSLLVERGVRVFELICTLGDLGAREEGQTRDDLARIRRDEAEMAAGILGISDLAILEHHDGELEPSLDLRAQIALYYRRWQPDTLFTFDPSWAGQIHPDHRAAGRAAVDAIMPSRMPLYRPEQLAGARVCHVSRAFLFSPAVPSVLVDVSAVYAKKLAACTAHVSQFPDGEKSLEWMRRLDAEAARRGGKEDGLYEQFGVLAVW